MLSRVADSIFWMTRYVERAENLARFLEVTLHVILDHAFDDEPQWQPLVSATGDNEYFEEHYDGYTEANVVQFLTFDRDYHGSILSSISAARENARSIREVISSEMWEQINEFHLYVNESAGSEKRLENLSDFYRHVKQNSHLFHGIMDGTMNRGNGWHFANLGRLLERADKTGRILDVKYFTLLPSAADVGTTIDDLQWSAVLRSVSGYETYRKRYHSMTVRKIVEFVVLDSAFPRAIRYCIDGADKSLHQISGSPRDTYCNSAEKHLGRLLSKLVYTDAQSIIDSGLHQFVDHLQLEINQICDNIHATFIANRPLESNGIWPSTQSQTQSSIG